ncbi:uncharacterized protein KGF55_000002 [Candida pseudojiufengensis]|uniref:uncharacterized protein n=1 Tax=Candida pseudojiufengensis TaxID=497109 RepID=UPI0022256069|nr:uncharacterized protein KGF55_000002 [Candida pseudojiufengensis]KAI5968173.1 hypothetical protein KGF55_000002 [Candida pseudojiufengensis]
MSSVIVSNTPNVPPSKIIEFFSFCGSVKDLIPLGKDENGKGKYEVLFNSPKAVSTALLLNDAELDNTFIRVDEVPAITDGEVGKAPQDDGPGEKLGSATSSTTKDVKPTGDKTYDDVDQEEKPKYAILAQLLADGYVLSDQIIDKGLEFDKKNGYSTKFQNFIESLDSKYVHSKDPNSTVNQQISKGQDFFEKSGLQKYFDDAVNSNLGLKIHEFYKSFANDAKDVHNEAVRLAKIKKSELEKKEKQESSTTGTGATSSTSGNTDSTTPVVKA